jgi:Fe-only nitrogenase accessory protein AnfO
MKIAIYIDEHEQVATFPEGCLFRLYVLEGGFWVPECDVPLHIEVSMGLTRLTATINNAIHALGDCKVALLGDLRGLLRALLEEHGFRTWKSSGTLSEQLLQVAEKEQSLQAYEQAAAEDEARFLPQLQGEAADGNFYISLAEILKESGAPASRDMLLPFLEAGAFRLLEIECDHLPRWFDAETSRLGLQVEKSEPDLLTGNIQLKVRPGLEALLLPMPPLPSSTVLRKGGGSCGSRRGGCHG